MTEEESPSAPRNKPFRSHHLTQPHGRFNPSPCYISPENPGRKRRFLFHSILPPDSGMKHRLMG
jgi:hypothetical protein